MLTGAKNRDRTEPHSGERSDPRTEGDREHADHSGVRCSEAGGSRSRRQAGGKIRGVRVRVERFIELWTPPVQQLFPDNHAHDESGVRRAWDGQGGDHNKQRQHSALACGFIFAILASVPACHRRVAPEAAFAHAHKTFVRGDLKQSQDESHAQCEQLKDSEPEWAWKFRILEAEFGLWRGMSEDTLKLLNSQTTRPTEQNAVVEMLALKVAAYAHLRNFEEADSNLEGAQQLCAKSDDATCGNVIRAQGVLAYDRGDFPAAERYFAQSLTFARAHKDKFLEATALLNIAAAMLKEERFSEAIDWSRSAYDVSTAVEARNIGLVAQENIGWAYYNLGDSERALDLFLQAKETAVKSSDVIDQVSLLTDAGYVYAKTQDYSRAKREYLQALTLSRPTRNAQHIYNALRALALLSVERGELEEARSYADEALVMAQAGKNRLDELYPLLVKGLIAARVHDEAKAERIFREVEKDRHGNASLKWRGNDDLQDSQGDMKAA